MKSFPVYDRPKRLLFSRANSHGVPIPNHAPKRRRIACQTTFAFLWLGVTALFAAPSASEGPSSIRLAWLRWENTSSFSSRDVFDAFHSTSGPTGAPFDTAALPAAPPPAIYPDEFRSIDGRRNAPGNLGIAGS